MKQIKRILSIALAVALLCAVAAPFAHGLGDLTAENVSGYLKIELGGGWHALYYDNGEKAFEPASIASIFSQETLDLALAALKKLNINAAASALIDALKEFFWPIRMNEAGESVVKNLNGNGNMYNPEAIQGDMVRFGWDWRLSPMDNAVRLEEYIQWLREQRPGDPALEKINFHGLSGSGPILMAYLQRQENLDDVASIWIDVTMHKGTSMFGEIAKRNIMINVEAIAKANAIGFNELLQYDITGLQPFLRILYESGLLDAVERTAKHLLNPLIDRIDKEIVTSMLFMMPQLWAYVPAKDYAAAKKAQFGEDPRYAKLKAKLNDYHYNVQLKADDILRNAAKHVKVGVWAGYGLPLLPLGPSAAAQGDFQVDAAYAGLGATAAPYGSTFPSGYKQVNTGCGHDHISPDRRIDASTCLLPEQTWFALNRPHSPEYSYSGWYEWFLKTPNPTVNSKEYPQFVKTVTSANSKANGHCGQYIPLEIEQKNETFLDKLKACLLTILRHWRWLVKLAFFWVK